MSRRRRLCRLRLGGFRLPTLALDLLRARIIALMTTAAVGGQRKPVESTGL